MMSLSVKDRTVVYNINHSFLTTVIFQILLQRKETPSDRAFLASVQLLQALWHERRTLVISYIRMRENFFSNFCYPLFHITEQQK